MHPVVRWRCRGGGVDWNLRSRLGPFMQIDGAGGAGVGGAEIYLDVMDM